MKVRYRAPFVVLAAVLFGACSTLSSLRSSIRSAFQPTEENGLGTVGYLDARNGFRDAQFGSSPAAEMQLSENDGDEKFYKRPSENLTLGDAHLSEVLYGYYRDRLAFVLLKTANVDDSTRLLRILASAYGSGEPTDSFQTVWKGEKVVLVYKQNPSSGAADVTMSSREFRAEVQKQQNQSAEKGAEQL